MSAQASLFERTPDLAVPPSGAVIHGVYRYELWRTWGDSTDRVCWVMLNPSTADHRVDDPTIRRCISFSKRWGHGGLDVVNLFALRATDPREIRGALDAIGGPDNDETIARVAHTATIVVCAWGKPGAYRNRDKRVLELLCAARPQGGVHCLGTNIDGSPKHPLYLPDDTRLVPFGGGV